MKWIIPILLIIGATAIAVSIVRKQQRKSLAPKSKEEDDKKDSFSDRIKAGWNWITGQKITLPVLILAFAAMFTWRESWAKTPWNWIWTHWVFSLVVIGLIISWSYAGKSTGKIRFSTDSALKWVKIAFIVGMLYVCVGIGGCLTHMAEEHPCPFTAPNAVAEARMRAELAPPPPTDIRMGTWIELVPPGECSKWEVWHKGYKTSSKLSSPAKYLKGKLVGRDVLAYDTPLKIESPSQKVTVSNGEAIKYFNEGTNVLSIRWSRTWK